jgi:hypothetical protein
MAAQRWLTKEVESNGFCPRGMILPLAGEFGDWSVTVPL